MKEYIVPVSDKGNMNMIENELHLQQLVRCKNCKHYEPDKYDPGKGDCNGRCDNLVKVSDNWFCADGERRTDDA